MNLNAVNDCARSGAGPSAAQQIHAVSFRNEPAEDLMKVKLCPARLRILAILPVEYEDSHLENASPPGVGVQHAVYEFRAR